jgi:selenocysteine-specific elongation factor
VIVGTGKYIDHKTTLVRALTGVDTDRLPEEKKRGISIELGYAFLDVPDSDQRIGFVDVPGHERLVHTMLAGATGIDFALLLVAADDGVMPQTREHLAVLSLLGLSRGAVVVTKADRADAQRVQAVCDEATALLAGTPLAGAPVLAVSALGGEGLPALKALLLDAARGAPPAADAAQAFRLAIDRVFTLDGVGTVATGTVHAGTVRVGDTLRLVPGDRVLRSLHARTRRSMCAVGQRCAVALVGGCEHSRGSGSVAGHRAGQRPSTRLTLWHAESRALRSGTLQHCTWAPTRRAQVAMLDRTTAAPASGAVQLVLGDRSAPGMATAWCCAMPRPRARWPVAQCSIRSRRCAYRARRAPGRTAGAGAATAAGPWPRAGGARHGRDLHGCARRRASELPPLPEACYRAGGWGWRRCRRRWRQPGRWPRWPRTSAEERPRRAARLRRLAAAAMPERCGARCSTRCAARRGRSAAPSCTCPNMACGCRPAKSASRRRSRRGSSRPAMKAPGRATWHATRTSRRR